MVDKLESPSAKTGMNYSHRSASWQRKVSASYMSPVCIPQSLRTSRQGAEGVRWIGLIPTGTVPLRTGVLVQTAAIHRNRQGVGIMLGDSRRGHDSRAGGLRRQQ